MAATVTAHARTEGRVKSQSSASVSRAAIASGTYTVQIARTVHEPEADESLVQQRLWRLQTEECDIFGALQVRTLLLFARVQLTIPTQDVVCRHVPSPYRTESLPSRHDRSLTFTWRAVFDDSALIMNSSVHSTIPPVSSGLH
jgi:hypothetical protein